MTFIIKLKSILTNLKTPGTMFLLIPFSNIKKSILTNLKIPCTIFLLIPSNIKKAHLRISKHPFHANTNNFKGNNLHKNHYTNNSHKNNYTNQ